MSFVSTTSQDQHVELDYWTISTLMDHRSTEDGEKRMGCLIAWLPAFLCVEYALRAWALSKLWTWFVVPAWNIPTPPTAVLLGLSVLVGLLTDNYNPNQAEDGSRSQTQRLILMGVWPLFKYPCAVLTGWILRHWL